MNNHCPQNELVQEPAFLPTSSSHQRLGCASSVLPVYKEIWNILVKESTPHALLLPSASQDEFHLALEFYLSLEVVDLMMFGDLRLYKTISVKCSVHMTHLYFTFLDPTMFQRGFPKHILCKRLKKKKSKQWSWAKQTLGEGINQMN